MPRIRTTKPSFFRHEALQELEQAHPGQHVMLVFSALWGHCDRGGVFEWQPKYLKLDILPFLAFDLAETLAILTRGGMIQRYESGGKAYGYIPTFADHQIITGKEKTAPLKHPRPDGAQTGTSIVEPPEHPETTPEPVDDETGTSPRIAGESTEITGREGKGKGIGTGKGVDVHASAADADLAPAWGHRHARRTVPGLRDLDYHRRNCPVLPFPWAEAACAAGFCIPKYLWPRWEQRGGDLVREDWCRQLQAFVERVIRDEPRAPGDSEEIFWPEHFRRAFGETVTPARAGRPTAAEVTVAGARQGW